MNLDFRPAFLLRLFFIFLIGLIFVNLIILDIKMFKDDSLDKQKAQILTNKQTDNYKIDSLLTPTPIIAACPGSCLLKINEATASIKLSQPENNKSLRQSSSNQSSQVLVTSGVKEFFIPFGSGSNSSDDWTDVSGLQAYVDSTQYGGIKSVIFEASMRIPTGNEVAYARLFNITDKHPVWFSEVSLEGGTPQLLISQPVTFDSGRKLYQVQMKTSLKYQAILDQARLHITTY